MTPSEYTAGPNSFSESYDFSEPLPGGESKIETLLRLWWLTYRRWTREHPVLKADRPAGDLEALTTILLQDLHDQHSAQQHK